MDNVFEKIWGRGLSIQVDELVFDVRRYLIICIRKLSSDVTGQSRNFRICSEYQHIIEALYIYASISSTFIVVTFDSNVNGLILSLQAFALTCGSFYDLYFESFELLESKCLLFL